MHQKEEMSSITQIHGSFEGHAVLGYIRDACQYYGVLYL